MGDPLPPPATAAGWYPDPGGPPGQQRYWDGRAWTAVQPAPPPPKNPGQITPTGKVIVVALAAVALFALIAVITKVAKGDGDDAPSAASSAPRTTAAAPAGDPTDERFLETIRDAGVSRPLLNDAEALTLAPAICFAYKQAPDTRIQVAALNLVRDYPQLSPEQAGTVIGAAVGGYCPEYRNF